MNRIDKYELAELMAENGMTPDQGFDIVKTSMEVVTEDLFSFKSNPDLFIHFRSEDCTSFLYVGTIYKLVDRLPVLIGKFEFTGNGYCKDYPIDWNDVFIID